MEDISIFGNISIFVTGDRLGFQQNKLLLLILLTLVHILEVPLEHQAGPLQQHKACESNNETLVQICLGPHSSKASLALVGFYLHIEVNSN